MIVTIAVSANRTNARPVAARQGLPGIARGSESRGAGNNFAAGAVCCLMAPNQTPASPTADATRSAHFERYVLPHLDAAYGLARWLARNEHDAEDVLQETMLRAYRYYDLGGRDNVRAWLLTIVRNTFYTLRKQTPAMALLDEFDEEVHGADDDVSTPESQLLRAADVQRVRAAIELLPVEFREVLVLREFEECSYKDIVAVTGLKMGTVMSRLARARERLARQLHAGADAGQSDGGQQHAMQ